MGSNVKIIIAACAVVAVASLALFTAVGMNSNGNETMDKHDTRLEERDSLEQQHDTLQSEHTAPVDSSNIMPSGERDAGSPVDSVPLVPSPAPTHLRAHPPNYAFLQGAKATFHARTTTVSFDTQLHMRCGQYGSASELFGEKQESFPCSVKDEIRDFRIGHPRTSVNHNLYDTDDCGDVRSMLYAISGEYNAVLGDTIGSSDVDIVREKLAQALMAEFEVNEFFDTTVYRFVDQLHGFMKYWTHVYYNSCA